MAVAQVAIGSNTSCKAMSGDYQSKLRLAWCALRVLFWGIYVIWRLLPAQKYNALLEIAAARDDFIFTKSGESGKG